MIAINLKKFVKEYWAAISGKPKSLQLLEKFITDPELIGHVMAFEKPFPSYELVADDFICEDDKVVVRGRAKGINKGEFMGVPPTGNSIEIPLSVIYQIKNDKIVKSWLFFDQMELMNQLGLSSKN